MGFRRFLFHSCLGLVTFFLMMYSYASDLPEVTWDVFASVNINKKSTYKDVAVFNNKDIRVVGFIVPLDFGEDFYTVTEFLLVPDPLSCIHIPPPPPNPPPPAWPSTPAWPNWS